MQDYCAADSLICHSCLGNSNTKESLESLTLYLLYIVIRDDLYLVRSGIVNNPGNSLKMSLGYSELCTVWSAGLSMNLFIDSVGVCRLQ